MKIGKKVEWYNLDLLYEFVNEYITLEKIRRFYRSKAKKENLGRIKKVITIGIIHNNSYKSTRQIGEELGISHPQTYATEFKSYQLDTDFCILVSNVFYKYLEWVNGQK